VLIVLFVKQLHYAIRKTLARITGLDISPRHKQRRKSCSMLYYIAKSPGKFVLYHGKLLRSIKLSYLSFFSQNNDLPSSAKYWVNCNVKAVRLASGLPLYNEWRVVIGWNRAETPIQPISALLSRARLAGTSRWRPCRTWTFRQL